MFEALTFWISPCFPHIDLIRSQDSFPQGILMDDSSKGITTKPQCTFSNNTFLYILNFFAHPTQWTSSIGNNLELEIECLPCLKHSLVCVTIATAICGFKWRDSPAVTQQMPPVWPRLRWMLPGAGPLLCLGWTNMLTIHPCFQEVG